MDSADLPPSCLTDEVLMIIFISALETDGPDDDDDDDDDDVHVWR